MINKHISIVPLFYINTFNKKMLIKQIFGMTTLHMINKMINHYKQYDIFMYTK